MVGLERLKYNYVLVSNNNADSNIFKGLTIYVANDDNVSVKV